MVACLARDRRAAARELTLRLCSGCMLGQGPQGSSEGRRRRRRASNTSSSSAIAGSAGSDASTTPRIIQQVSPSSTIASADAVMTYTIANAIAGVTRVVVGGKVINSMTGADIIAVTAAAGDIAVIAADERQVQPR